MYGPLINVWAMRFESKHSYFKKVIQTTQNFKNVTKMLSHRHQLLQAYLAQGSRLPEDIVADNLAPINFNLLSSDVLTAIKACGLKRSDNVHISDRVKIFGTGYSKEMIVVLTADLGVLELGSIISVLIVSKVVYFLLWLVKESYVSGKGFYSLEKSHKIVCVSYRNLRDYSPLMEYKIKGNSYTVLKTNILYDEQ